ncbi:MAG TPA: undecaprenyl-diphosphate phosphatase [Syntrophobacteraceae bacterium]|nr:undecaprenyl-diphosphate phosphatase [Syntrophobacteraceae bacterium]
MSLGQAVILGVVEGLTEYLPVSSTGHLLLTERLLGIGAQPTASPEDKQRTKEASDAYTICIQAGAIVAVLGLYARRVRQMVRGLLGRDPRGLRLVGNIIAGFLPAAVIGLLGNRLIKEYLFGPWPVAIAWFAGGIVILVVDRWQRRSGSHLRTSKQLEDLTWPGALVIGLVQCLAMWPGTSRSLVTILGGLLVGLSLPVAVEFSFLLGVVTLGAATSYDAFKHGQLMLQMFDPLSLAVGLVFAFLAAVLSVRWMVGYLNRHGLAVFGYYRVALAVFVLPFILKGYLQM